MAKAKVGDIIKTNHDGELLVTSIGAVTGNARADGCYYSDNEYEVVWSPRPDATKPPVPIGCLTDAHIDALKRDGRFVLNGETILYDAPPPPVASSGAGSAGFSGLPYEHQPTSTPAPAPVAERPTLFRIRRGALVGQDFRYFAWPGEYEDRVDTEFTERQPLMFDDKRGVNAVAHGFGIIGGADGKSYGNGSIHVADVGDLIPIPPPPAATTGKGASDYAMEACAALLSDDLCSYSKAVALARTALAASRAGGGA